MRFQKQQKNESNRLKLITVVFLVVCIVFVYKLFIIQVLGHKQFKAMAEEQYWDLQELPARRGDILSSDGFSLASTQTYYLMYAEPKVISNPNKVADDLAAKLVELNFSNSGEKEIDSESTNEHAELFVKYKNKIQDSLSLNLFWVALERNLSPLQKEQLEALNIEGIGFEDEPVRYYPEGDLVSHVLGFVASDEKGEKTGYFGIEGFLDRDLRGKPGRIVEERDALGNPILVGGHKKVDSINGRRIVLTINRSVQYIVEKKLKEAVEKYDAISGTVIVMDPLTGDVISMANFPSYDPSDFSDYAENTSSSTSQFENRKKIERVNLAVSETFEPGSVIKALTVSAGIDLKKITPETSYEDNGPVNYSGYTIDNWDRKHHGKMNVIQLLQKSNNIGAAWVGQLVGSKELFKYFTSYGLGDRTGIDLEGEEKGILREFKTWTDIDLANASFGQGLSATPIQVLNAFNVMANGGELMRPRIVSKIIDDKEIIEIPIKPVRRVISKETSNIMVDLLTQAAAGGESKYFNLKNYKIAGKTGTAQIFVDGKWDPDKTNASFVGFLPESKKFSMIVRLHGPRTSIYAAETAVPLWMGITEELVKYFGIPPDKTDLPDQMSVN